jgi:hypothetical protein
MKTTHKPFLPAQIAGFWTRLNRQLFFIVSSFFFFLPPVAYGQNLRCSGYANSPTPGQWQSSKVYYSKGHLTYASDKEKNRIPDFSYAGYHYGEKKLPSIAVVSKLSPLTGDNTERIQAALDAIATRPLDEKGHRGTVLLTAGKYEIHGTIYIRQSGVVLRGVGDGLDAVTNTILFAKGNMPAKRTVVVVGSGNNNPWKAADPINIIDSFVQVGSMQFNVANSSGLKVGQDVLVKHPSTQAWIDALGGGGMTEDSNWVAGTKDLSWIRKITRIEGTRVYLDAPVYNHLDRSLTQSSIAPLTSKNIVSEAGIENLRVDIETLGEEDENHAWTAISFTGAENCWANGVSARYFGYAGFKTNGAILITMLNCRSSDPVAVRTGGNMYTYSFDAYSQLILLSNCHAGAARHSFVSNGTTTASGIVVYNCTMEGGDFEGHRHWSQGLLCDNLRELSDAVSQAKLINRGNMGTSHGWGAAHSVIWNFNKQIIVQKPPTAQNYAVSSAGSLRDKPFQPGPWGSIEIQEGILVPQSLYKAQLCERLTSSQVAK